MESSLYRSRSSLYPSTPLRRTAEHLELQEEAIGKESFLLMTEKISDVNELRTELQRRDLLITDLRQQVSQLSNCRDAEIAGRRELAAARDALRSAEAQATVLRRNYEAALRERTEMEARLAATSNSSRGELRRTVTELDAARRRAAELEDGVATRDVLIRQLQADVDTLVTARRSTEAANDRTAQEHAAVVRDLSDALRETEAKLNGQTQRVGGLEVALRDQESDSTVMRNRIRDLEQRLASAEGALASARSDAQRASTELAAAQNSVRERDQALSRAAEVRAALDDQVRDLSRRLENSVPRGDYDEMIRARDDAVRTATLVREDLASLRTEQRRLADDNTYLAGAVDARSREVEALQTTVAVRERELAAATRRAADISTQLEGIARERDDVTRKVDSLTNDLARSTRIILDTEDRLRTAEDRADVHRREAAEAVAERQVAAERRLALARERAAVDEELAGRIGSALSTASPARAFSRPSYTVPSPMAVSRAAPDLTANDLRDVIADLDGTIGHRVPTSPHLARSAYEDLSASRLATLRSSYA